MKKTEQELVKIIKGCEPDDFKMTTEQRAIKTASHIQDERFELEKLKAFRKGLNDSIRELEENLAYNESLLYNLTGEDGMKGKEWKYEYKPSYKVEVDEERLPAKYWREKKTREPDKAKIKKALNEGEEIPGAIQSINWNLRIKGLIDVSNQISSNPFDTEVKDD